MSIICWAAKKQVFPKEVLYNVYAAPDAEPGNRMLSFLFK